MKKTLKIPRDVTKIINKLTKRGFKAYIVGGAVRDVLLKKERADFDITTNAKPKEVTALFPKVIPTGIKHGTVTVVLNKKNYEITTFRVEGKYTDGRRPDKVKFVNDLKLDLSRRDFTINAMAYDILSKEILDPFFGLKDLKKRIIKTVGNPVERFEEDSLRVIRAARFASRLNFKIEKRTSAAMGKVSGKIKNLSQERVRDELFKMMGAEKPSIGFNILKKAGVLKIFLPELVKADKFEQGPLHDHDLLKHTLIAVDNASKDNILLRFACLFHDLGKIETREIDGENYHFYGHEQKSSQIAQAVMKRLKFSNAQIDYTLSLISNHMFNYNDQWSDSAIKRLLLRVSNSSIDDLLSLREADAKACGKGKKVSKEFFQLKKRIEKLLKEDLALKITDLKVNGKDVMKILKLNPGKKVGDTLKILLDMVIDNSIKNERKALLKLLKSLNSSDR